MAVKHAAISAAIALLTAHVKFIRGSEIVESTYEGQHQFIWAILIWKTQPNRRDKQEGQVEVDLWKYTKRQVMWNK